MTLSLFFPFSLSPFLLLGGAPVGSLVVRLPCSPPPVGWAYWVCCSCLSACCFSVLLAQLPSLCQLLAPVGLWYRSAAFFSVDWSIACSVNWLLLLVSCVSAVWAPLQSVLFDDHFPARARVGTRMIVFSCQLLGCRSLARWPGWVASCFLLSGPRLLVRWPGYAVSCFLLSIFIFCVAYLLTARARAVVHAAVSYSPVRLAWLIYLFSSSVLVVLRLGRPLLLVVLCRRSSIVVVFPHWLFFLYPYALLGFLRGVQLPLGVFTWTHLV